MVAELDLTNN